MSDGIDPSPFHIVATNSPVLFSTGKSVILSDRAYFGWRLAESAGDNIVDRPEYLQTFLKEDDDDLEYVAGIWPEHGLIGLRRYGDCCESTIMFYERTGKSWHRVFKTNSGEFCVDVKEWDHGRWIALLGSDPVRAGRSMRPTVEPESRQVALERRPLVRRTNTVKKHWACDYCLVPP